MKHILSLAPSKPSDFLFILSGVSLLVSLPWLAPPVAGQAGSGFPLWLAAKVFYFLGLAFFIAKR